MYLNEAEQSPFQEEFRYFIGRDYWINLNQDKFERYYKMVNKDFRRKKLLRLNEKISNNK
jgi:hypothetical protein